MFKLRRYFSVVSLVALMLATGTLIGLYKHSATAQLVEHAERRNVVLTQFFVNSLWPRFESYVTMMEELDGDALRSHTETAQIQQALSTLTRDLPVLKVKIYNLDGLTIFSSDPSQIGERKINNRGLDSARFNGSSSSKLSFRDKFSAFSGEVFDRNLVETYVPVRQGDGPVQAVFELYADVTPLMVQINRAQGTLLIGLLATFGVLYLALLLIVSRADHILKKQYQDLIAKDELEHLAHYDTLTELPNRLLARSLLAQAMARARSSRHHLAVLFLDLDRFKNINDSSGHHFGDQVLQAVTSRLTKCMRRQDSLARHGGDEFIVLVEDLASSEDAAIIAKKLIDAFLEPLTVASRKVFITASVGISVYPRDGKTTDQLITHADAAMYHAKELGRNNFQFYTAELTENLAARYTLEGELRLALERDEFRIYYQPQLVISNQKIVGVEALLRWEHPRRGLLAPGEFMEVAQDAGLMPGITAWVLESACIQCEAWRAAGLPDIRMGVNLSHEDITRGTLIGVVENVLKKSRLDPRYLELEITESFIMGESEIAIHALEQLRTLGVSLAIDDFGTGYSSLEYLKRLPINRLKIDQSFVKDVSVNSDDLAIVHAIIALGHSLGMVVIAEGVETKEQRDTLLAQGCDELQGYLVHYPLTPDEFEVLLGHAHASKTRTQFVPRVAPAVIGTVETA